MKTLAELLSIITANKPFKKLIKSLGESDKVKSIYLDHIYGSSVSLVLKGLMDFNDDRPVLCVLPTEDEAGYLYQDLSLLFEESERDEAVSFFPCVYRRGIRYGAVDAANEVIRSQLSSRLLAQDIPHFIITYPEALAEGMINADEYVQGHLNIRVGDDIDRVTLREHLWEMGFEETDYVYNPGQFAVRGSLIDIYSYADEYPFRIDFFGDEVESIRTFEPESQLSRESHDSVLIIAATSSVDSPRHSIIEDLPKDTLLYIHEGGLIREALVSTYNTPPIHAEDNIFDSLDSMRKLLISPEVFDDMLTQHTVIYTGSLYGHQTRGRIIDFKQSPEPLFHKKFDLLSDAILKYESEGIPTYIMSGQKSQIARLEAIFEDQGRGVVFEPIYPTLHAGFVDKESGLICYTDHSIFERFHKYRLKSDQIRHNASQLTLKDIHKFEYGDYVVHINHGVGVFAGLFNVEQNGKIQECVRINYKDGDSIYVSIHSLHHISKYKSKDNDVPPKLHKLGTGAWDRLKEKTKKKVKDIARDLIQIYAKRLEKQGYAFSPDTYMQKELEASFMYEDTPDQELATAQVKEDMESAVPMDRLICGDVGFGKTEIAVRAAFKAASDSKQVALLVPTTVLAYQHYRTFKKRLADFPVTIDYLSRAKTTKERQTILSDLSEGRIDIIIGTHALISKRVKFKDLGLLIIDEEQKFGVAAKERLRQYRTHIDTLTMTATPIPRTLQFSLMGARDLSNIMTPPPNRYPIRTEQAVFDLHLIAEVINYELAREGQVFFVHNRIHNIRDVASAIISAIPGVRIGIGHGQMDPKTLETLLIDFADHKYDVLLTTSIVENGIDVPNANTIIINDAHRFGLSDLHQLRGRVGRSDRKAFCYLLTPPMSDLTVEAKRRLRAITTFSELGSGIHIAMQDLDIRGAGNLLGAEQSGFIADLGYETYRRILEEAVMELKDDEFADLLEQQEQQHKNNSKREIRSYVYETNIETDIEAFLPPMYVPGDDERISLYRELDCISQEVGLIAFRERLEDRFGPLPVEAEELIRLMKLRIIAKKAGVEKIILKNKHLRLHLVSDFNSYYYKSETFATLLSNASMWGPQLQFKEDNQKRQISISGVSNVTTAIETLEKLLSND